MSSTVAALEDRAFTKRARLGMCALALFAALAFGASLATPSVAWADVRKTDMIMGASMEERGIAAARCPSIDAEHAILVDADGTVYFERNAADPVQIASITKVMTAVVALDYAPLDTEVTVSARAAEVGESSANLKEGDVLTLESALKALMMPSGNDAAIAIAESVGRLMLGDASAGGEQAQDAFVAAMNEKAVQLGCADSLFENPHGLDDGEFAGNLHSTAADVAKFSAYAMNNEAFRAAVSKESDVIKVKRGDAEEDLELTSTDELLGVYEGACGIKTGFTDQAGACFAGAACRGDKELYAIVLHSSSEAQRFADATTLFDWVYSNQVDYSLANSSESVSLTLNGTTTEVPLVARVSHASWVDRTINASFADPSATVSVFALNGNVSQSFEFKEVTGAVRAGDVLGTATFYQRNQVIARQDIIACEDVSAPGLFEGIGIWWDRLFRSLSGSPEQAESVITNDTPLIYDKQSLELA